MARAQNPDDFGGQKNREEDADADADAEGGGGLGRRGGVSPPPGRIVSERAPLLEKQL